MPSWKGITPDSAFFQRMPRLPIPPRIDCVLLFSHAGDSRMMAGGNEGAVTITSQLPGVAQDRASLICGFSESHASILESEELRRKLNVVLTNELERRPVRTGIPFVPSR